MYPLGRGPEVTEYNLIHHPICTLEIVLSAQLRFTFCAEYGLIGAYWMVHIGWTGTGETDLLRCVCSAVDAYVPFLFRYCEYLQRC